MMHEPPTPAVEGENPIGFPPLRIGCPYLEEYVGHAQNPSARNDVPPTTPKHPSTYIGVVQKTYYIDTVQYVDVRVLHSITLMQH